MNDPISLDNLHPIVLPQGLGLWPIAPGWYLIALLLASTIIFLTYKNRQKRKANQYRRDALQQLSILHKRLDQGEAENALRALPVLIKATALCAYKRDTIAALYGEAWLDFLNGTLPAPHFDTKDGELLARVSYGTPGEILAIGKDQSSQLLRHVEYWIQHHILRDGEEVGDD